MLIPLFPPRAQVGKKLAAASFSCCAARVHLNPVAESSARSRHHATDPKQFTGNIVRDKNEKCQIEKASNPKPNRPKYPTHSVALNVCSSRLRVHRAPLTANGAGGAEKSQAL
jgi:hypothetical protein